MENIYKNYIFFRQIKIATSEYFFFKYNPDVQKSNQYLKK